MSFVNPASKEIHLKIVYAGPGLSGKTTNIQYIYENTQSPSKGKLLALSTENERTLFFDFLPLAIGDVNGYDTRFHIFSIPGQTFYEISQQFLLKGVDGVVFVADSQPERMEANLESVTLLKKNLETQGFDLNRLPFVFQYNKRDLASATPIHELENALNPMKKPMFEGIAHQGKGVMETLQAISQWVIGDFRGERGGKFR